MKIKYKENKFFINFHIDYLLCIIILIILFYSLLVYWSASNQNFFIFKKRIIQIVLGFITMIVFSQISPKFYERIALLMYLLFIILLIEVYFYGQTINGAKRWLNFFGLLKFQPSEMFKLIFPLLLAKFANKKILPLSIKNTILACILILFPVILIGIQPDLGTATLAAVSGFFILFLIGIKKKAIIIIFIICVCFFPILWIFLMHNYQRDRIITLFMPSKDYLGSGYNILQSKIAIGSGGLYGKGWLLGSQAKLGFLPEKNTDFIFSLLAEEFGFFGVTILVLLYLLLIIRIIFILFSSKNAFEIIISGGIMFIFFIYVLVNISMVSGILPVVGVPLPLFSYGGTSTIIIMSNFGIIMSVYSHKKFYIK